MPLLFAPTLTRRATRMLVLWLIALVLPLQGTAVGVFTVIGPAHLHQRVNAAPLVLEDVRRWRPAAVPQAHVFAALGHFHASATPQQRHHHAADDASVVRIAAADPAGDDAVNPGAGVAAVLALIPAALMWAAPDAPDPRASRARWSVRTGFVAPPERPPKAA